MLDGRGIRLQRLMGDGRAVIVAIDHGLFDGPIAGMEDLPATAARINPAVNAVLLAPGMLAVRRGVRRIETSSGRGPT